MNTLKSILVALCTLTFAFNMSAQSSETTYEITITTIDEDGQKASKKLKVVGEEMNQEEIDAIVQEHLTGNEVNVNVEIDMDLEEVNERADDSKTHTKIIRKRIVGSDEDITIENIESMNEMEVEVIDDKVYINGEEVIEGDDGNRKIRILKFDSNDDIDIGEILEGEGIDIEDKEKVYIIERESITEGPNSWTQKRSGAFLGIGMESNPNRRDGVKIAEIMKGQSAEKAGLKVGDKIISINEKEVNTPGELVSIIRTLNPDDEVLLAYEREGQEMEVNTFLGDKMDYNNPMEKQWARKKRHSHKNSYKKDCCSKQKSSGPYLGVEIQDENNQVLISKVPSGMTPARLAGLQSGDIVLKVNKDKISNTDQFISTIKSFKSGDELKLQILRAGKKKKVLVTLEDSKTCTPGCCAPKNGRLGMGDRNVQIEKIIIKDKSEDEQSRIIDRNDIEEKGVIEISSFDLSPNPSKGEVNVNFTMPASKEITLRVISLEGKIIDEEVLTDFNGKYENVYDLSEQAAGIYLFQIEKDKQLFTKRFVLSRN